MVPNVADARDMRKQAKEIEDTAAVLTDKDAVVGLTDAAAELEEKADVVETDAQQQADAEKAKVDETYGTG